VRYLVSHGSLKILRKSKIAALTLLVCMLAGCFFVNSASAVDFTPRLHVNSPVDGAVYNTDSVALSYTLDTMGDTQIGNTYYVFEGCNLEFFLDGNDFFPGVSYTFEKLSNGVHELKIYASSGYTIVNVGSSVSLGSHVVVNFTVNSGVAPPVSVTVWRVVESNATVYVVTDRTTGSVCYSVDGKANVTVPNKALTLVYGHYQYNLTLAGLADGQHNVTAYSVDAMGNSNVSAKTFAVGTQTQSSTEPSSSSGNVQPKPLFSTTAIIVGAVIAGVFVACVIFLMFNRKTKPKEKTKPETQTEQPKEDTIP
jgi:hypothetical protein